MVANNDNDFLADITLGNQHDANIYSGFRELVIFPNIIFFRQHKWITKLFFNTQQGKFLFAALNIWFAFGAARLVEFRLVSFGDWMA